jgi:hypothetical protein
LIVRAMRHRRVLLLLFGVAATLGAPPGPRAAPALQPGSVELGLAGSVVAVEGTTRAEILSRGGTFIGLGPGLAGVEMEVGYEHRSALDALLLLWDVSWQMPIGGSGILPFVAVGGGVQQEWIGSFGETRAPVGVHVGLRALAGTRAGVRAEYRFQRVLGDPASDYNQHTVLFGLSLYLRNGE